MQASGWLFECVRIGLGWGEFRPLGFGREGD